MNRNESKVENVMDERMMERRWKSKACGGGCSLLLVVRLVVCVVEFLKVGEANISS